MMPAAKELVAEFLKTLKDFPLRQKAANFTIDQAMEKMESVGSRTAVESRFLNCKSRKRSFEGCSRLNRITSTSRNIGDFTLRAAERWETLACFTSDEGFQPCLDQCGLPVAFCTRSPQGTVDNEWKAAVANDVN